MDKKKSAALQEAERPIKPDANEIRIALCDMFKSMTFARITAITKSKEVNPDEIRAVRECFELIMKLGI